jgi:glucosamine--fructose-6-phosphate aminotransferase (isomerizing)
MSTPTGAFDFAADCVMALEVLDRLSTPWQPLVAACATGTPLLVAEGSSRLVPLGVVRRLSRAWGVPGPDGCTGRQVPAQWRGPLVAVSNSGRTREVIEGLRGRSYLAITGVAGGPLATGAGAALAVLPRPERAVAATASVLGQAWVVAAAWAAACGRPLDAAPLRRALQGILPAEPPPCERLWVVGADDGVAEELALKAWETAGLPATAVAAGLALHGLEEVVRPGDAVWLIDVDPADRDPIAARLAPTGVAVLSLDAPDAGELSPLVRLAAGWRWLAAWAAQRGRDPARPLRARKVGNDIAGG